MTFFRLLILLMFLPSVSVYSKDFRVGVLYWSDTIPCQVYMSKGLESAATQLSQQHKTNYQLITRLAGDGPAGINNQINQMNELIDLEVDLIVVQPTDNAALSAPLIRANQANIPVVAYDQYISKGQLLSYVTSDNYQAGFYNGEYIADLFTAQTTPIKLVLVEYANVSSTVERLNGFLDALQHFKVKFEILKSYSAVEPISGTRAGKDILKDFPTKNSIDVVFTVNDGGGLNVVRQLAEAKRHEIVVATIDGDPASIKNIQEKRLTQVDTAQFCGPMGEQAMVVAAKHLAGETVAAQILLPVFPITIDTLDRYPGWSGPIPAAFKKPWKSDVSFWKNTIRSVQ